VILCIKLVFTLLSTVAFEILRKALCQIEFFYELKLENVYLHNAHRHEFAHKLFIRTAVEFHILKLFLSFLENPDLPIVRGSYRVALLIDQMRKVDSVD
jgi:hypothetical protein